MPQLFQVLRCMKCLVFQVHQTKKSNKWACKICGEKQSIKRNYAIGTAKDCRVHVQKLNGVRGQIDESMVDMKNDDGFDSDDNCDVKGISTTQRKSKWSSYTEESKKVEANEVKQEWFGAQVVIELPKKIKKEKISVSTDCSKIDNDSHVNLQFVDKDLTTLECTDRIKPKFAKNTTIASNQAVLDKLKNCQKQMNTKSLVEIKSRNDSKWGQFLDEQDGDNENIEENGRKDYKIEQNCIVTDNKVTVRPQTIFTTCDDNEIDDILNIEF